MLSKNTFIKAAISGLGIMISNLPMKVLGDEVEIYDIERHDEEFRALNCWECFDSHGKICHNRDATKHKKMLDNSNLGHGICCKPGSTSKECTNDLNHICSDLAEDTDPNSPNKPILSKNNMNHQMFAFCPLTNQKVCGISESTSTDMTVRP